MKTMRQLHEIIYYGGCIAIDGIVDAAEYFCDRCIGPLIAATVLYVGAHIIVAIAAGRF